MVVGHFLLLQGCQADLAAVQQLRLAQFLVAQAQLHKDLKAVMVFQGHPLRAAEAAGAALAAMQAELLVVMAALRTHQQ